VPELDWRRTRRAVLKRLTPLCYGRAQFRQVQCAKPLGVRRQVHLRALEHRFGAGEVPVGIMMERNCYLDEPLEEPSVIPLRLSPDVLENFVSVKVPAVIKHIKAALVVNRVQPIASLNFVGTSGCFHGTILVGTGKADSGQFGFVTITPSLMGA